MTLKNAEKDMETILFTGEQIEKRISEIAQELNEHYKDEEVLAVGILKGCVPFYWDLIKQLTFPVSFDFMVV